VNGVLMRIVVQKTVRHRRSGENRQRQYQSCAPSGNETAHHAGSRAKFMSG
jgi:hypothetical protein